MSAAVEAAVAALVDEWVAELGEACDSEEEHAAVLAYLASTLAIDAANLKARYTERDPLAASLSAIDAAERAIRSP